MIVLGNQTLPRRWGTWRTFLSESSDDKKQKNKKKTHRCTGFDNPDRTMGGPSWVNKWRE